MRFKALLVATAGLLLAGCSSTITNLTPRDQVRNANGLYPFEMAWDSNQQSIRKDSIHPTVVIGFDSYPMRPAPVLKDRWETLVPIPGTNQFINYRFKVEYEYNAIPVPRKSSRLSTPYQLRVVDK